MRRMDLGVDEGVGGLGGVKGGGGERRVEEGGGRGAWRREGGGMGSEDGIESLECVS